MYSHRVSSTMTNWKRLRWRYSYYLGITIHYSHKYGWVWAVWPADSVIWFVVIEYASNAFNFLRKQNRSSIECTWSVAQDEIFVYFCQFALARWIAFVNQKLCSIEKMERILNFVRELKAEAPKVFYWQYSRCSENDQQIGIITSHDWKDNESHQNWINNIFHLCVRRNVPRHKCVDFWQDKPRIMKIKCRSIDDVWYLWRKTVSHLRCLRTSLHSLLILHTNS